MNFPAINISFKTAETMQEFSDAKYLFQEYAKSLEFDLNFQGFADELEHLNSQYNKPNGALILAYIENTPIACIGLRSFAADKAELKRMFVLPGHRGLKAGQQLLELAVNTAKDLGYRSILLDTLPSMKAAIHLYYSFGFKNIAPYRYNPMPGAVFMEKKL